MPAETNHPSFPQPTEQASIWRYMDLSRYLDIAVRGRLFFSRQDKFRDTFEGAIPSASRKALALQSKQLEQEQSKFAVADDPKQNKLTLEDQMMRFLERLRRETFISCWHMNSTESAAMWDLYGRDGAAIAFRTSYNKLKTSLPSYAYLGMVTYIDYEEGHLDLNNSMNPSMHKRKSFEHENEVRAVLPHFTGLNHAGFESREDHEAAHELTEFGLTLPFDINKAVDEIYLSPDANPWFVRLVRETNAKLGVIPPVRKSSLYDNVIF